MKTIHTIKELFQYQKPKFTTPEAVQNIKLVHPLQCTHYEYREDIGKYTYIYGGTVQIDEETINARVEVAYGKFTSGSVIVQQHIEEDKTQPPQIPLNQPIIYLWDELGRRKRISP